MDEVKELVQELLNLTGETDKKPDDIFYYGVFAEDDYYMEQLGDGDDIDDDIDDEEGAPEVTAEYDTPEHEKQTKKREEWLLNFKISIIKGEKEKPEWMERAETNYDDFEVDTELNLIVKDEKYAKFGKKVQKLLNGITADGYRDG